MDCFEPGQFVRREPQRAGGDVVLDVAEVARAGDDQHVRATLQGPGEADRGRSRLVLTGDREHLVVLGPAGARFAPGSGDGEERDAQWAGRRFGQPAAGRVTTRPDFGGDDQVLREGDSAVLISPLAERSEEQ